MGIMTAANIVAENLASLSYMKQTFGSSSYVYKSLLVKSDEAGLHYPVRGTDGGTTATMPAYNSGFTPTFALASTATEQAFKIGFSINISKAAIVGKKASDEIAMQVNAGLVSAASVFDTNFFYGSGNGTSAFKGVNARIASNASYAIAASVSGAVNTSAYFVVSGDYDSHLYVPAGLDLDSPSVIGLQDGTVDANGLAMAGVTVTVESYLGFVVHQNALPALGQIYYLNGTNYMTYDLFTQMYAKMSLGINNRAANTTVFMNASQYRLFAKDCGALITSIQDPQNPALRINTIDGVKIVSTETITNAESNKA